MQQAGQQLDLCRIMHTFQGDVERHAGIFKNSPTEEVHKGSISRHHIPWAAACRYSSGGAAGMSYTVEHAAVKAPGVSETCCCGVFTDTARGPVQAGDERRVWSLRGTGGETWTRVPRVRGVKAVSWGRLFGLQINYLQWSFKEMSLKDQFCKKWNEQILQRKNLWPSFCNYS